MATWCGPCRTSIPHLNELQRRFRGRGVEIVSISKEGTDRIEPFVRSQGERMGFTVAADRDGATYESWMEASGQGGIPHAFVVNREGKLAWRGHPTSGLGEAIRDALGDENSQ